MFFLKNYLDVDYNDLFTLLPFLALFFALSCNLVLSALKSSSFVIKLINQICLIVFALGLLDGFREDTILLFGESWVFGPLARSVGIMASVVVLLSTFISGSYNDNQNKNREWSVFSILSVLSVTVLVMVRDFISFYVCIETLSIASYLMAALNTKKAKSIESGMKYLLMGAFASAILLMGISFIYGLTGSFDYAVIAQFLEQPMSSEFRIGFILSLIFLVVGFSFKLSAAPVHMWSPDVYVGSPTSSTIVIATISKIAVFIGIIILFYFCSFAEVPELKLILKITAVMSVVIGSFMAFVQKELKRFLAFSGVVNVGYGLMLVALGLSSLDVMLYFVLQYVITFIALWVMIDILAIQFFNKRDEDINIEALSLLNQKMSPLFKIIFVCFLFSLLGMPPFPGFMGKYLILKDLWLSGEFFMVGTLIFGSLVGAAYYIKIFVPFFFEQLSVKKQADKKTMLGLDGTQSSHQISLIGHRLVYITSSILLVATLIGFSRFYKWLQFVEKSLLS